MYGYINNYLLEAAPTGSGPAGGTEIADMYVDEVSKTSSPEDLETASNKLESPLWQYYSPKNLYKMSLKV